MKLVRCKDCNHLISREAKNCPQCGKPQNRQQQAGCMGLIVLGLIIVGCWSLTKSSPNTPKTTQPNALTANTDSSPTDTSTSISPQPNTDIPPLGKEPDWNLLEQQFRKDAGLDDMKEPDWKAIALQLRTNAVIKFRLPVIGTEVGFTLQTGIPQQGKLLAITDKEISISKGQGSVSFGQESLQKSDRIKLFLSDYVQDQIGHKKAEYSLALCEAKGKVTERLINAKAEYRKKVEEYQQVQQVIADQKDYEEKRAKFTAMLSAWDGSFPPLVEALKQRLNDAGSFEHVRTTYTIDRNNITIFMTYRAKNAFGAKMLGKIVVRYDLTSNEMTMLSTNP